MNIKKLIARFRKMSVNLERGQALAEYWPTFAGAMAITIVVMIQVGGGAQKSFCKVVDAFGETPDTCETEDTPTEGDTPEESDEPIEAECIITLSSAEGTDSTAWNTEWLGEDDVLTINVTSLGTYTEIPWSLKLRFPTDPDSVDTEIASGVIEEVGEYAVTVPYPAEGEWGPVSADGYGTYESHATLNVATPCADVGWDRWYKAAWSADLAIGLTHDVSPVTEVGETLTYTVTVTNNGPNNSEVYNDEGTIVSLPAPEGVTVLSATPSQGVCDTQIVCDLGELPIYSSATITVVTTVADPETCELTGTSTVAATRPDDPDTSNNTATTSPWCEVVSDEEAPCVDVQQFGVATAYNAFALTNFTSSNSDTEGSLAVGNNATLSGYAVGYLLNSAWNGQNTLIVGNDLTFSSGSVYYGNVIVGGTASTTSMTVSSGSLLSGTSIDFSSAATYLKALSSVFASTEANGTAVVQYSSQLILTGTDETLNVFDVDGSILPNIYQTEIIVPDGSTVLINVSGSSISMNGGGFFFNGQQPPSSHSSSTIDDIARVVYNFPSATSITIPYGGIYGAIMAPKATISFNGGVVWGTVIANTYNGTAQIDYVPFTGCVPALETE